MKSYKFKNKRFCGPYGLQLPNLIKLSSNNGVTNYFNDALAFFTHSGRTAIRKASMLLGIKSGDEILAPSYNCGSELDPLLRTGVIIKFYKVNQRCQIDFQHLEKNISSKTKAIYVTHYFGFPQSIEHIKRILYQTGLPLIEDCALSLFSRAGAIKLGSIGSMSIFSFKKTLPVPDGGALIINDSNLNKADWLLKSAKPLEVCHNSLPIIKATVLRYLSRASMYRHRLYFINRRSTNKFQSEAARENVPEMPNNYYYDEKFTNKGISAISNFIIKNIDVDTIIHKRRKHYSHLLSMLSGYKEYQIIYKEIPDGTCPLSFPVIVQKRDNLIFKLLENSIDAIAWWKGYHKGLQWVGFPEAQFLKDNVLTLPVHQNLNDEDIEYIGKKFLSLVRAIN
jgi:perosamine synthetase